MDIIASQTIYYKNGHSANHGVVYHDLDIDEVVIKENRNAKFLLNTYEYIDKVRISFCNKVIENGEAQYYASKKQPIVVERNENTI